MSRITAADVTVSRDATVNGVRHVMAMVQGRNRVYVVDRNERWSKDWLCTCGHPDTCPHVRATKEAVGG